MAAPPFVQDWSLETRRRTTPAALRATFGPDGSAPPGAVWAWLCALCVIPLAAGLHNLVFYPQECMLNSFGAEYTAGVVWSWLSRDPSLFAAVLLAVLLHRLGKSRLRLRAAIPPFLVAFLPLSLWIWDLPLSGRSVCRLLHDGQVHLPGDVSLLARHLYVLGALAFVAMALPALRGLSRNGEAAVPSVGPLIPGRAPAGLPR